MALSARIVVLMAALAMLASSVYAPNGGHGIAADIGPSSSAQQTTNNNQKRGRRALRSARARVLRVSASARRVRVWRERATQLLAERAPLLRSVAAPLPPSWGCVRAMHAALTTAALTAALTAGARRRCAAAEKHISGLSKKTRPPPVGRRRHLLTFGPGFCAFAAPPARRRSRVRTACRAAGIFWF
jgi:hypothetical protein